VVVNKSPTPQPPEDLDDTSTVESEKKLPASEASLPEMDKQQLIKKLTEEAKDLVRGKTGTFIVTQMTSHDWMTLEDEAQFQDLMARLEDLGQNTDILWRIHDLYIRKHTLFHADPSHTANDLERRRIMEEDFFVCKELAELGEPMFWVYTDPVTGEELARGSYKDAVLGEWPFIFR
jgi:hypothetical protein